jgi:tetratricopeptide (TPR) repeat protein
MEEFLRGNFKSIVFGIVSSVLMSYPSWAGASPYGAWDIRDALEEISSDGESSLALNFNYIDRMLNDLSRHALTYPPRFDSESDKHRAITHVRQLAMIFDDVEGLEGSSKLLWRAAMLHHMGFNLDVSASYESANMYYQSLLKLMPASGSGYYYYGIYLLDSARPVMAIEVLDKAIELGNTKALRPLGLAYLAMEDRAQALNTMNRYLELFPDDASLSALYESLVGGAGIEKLKQH